MNPEKKVCWEELPPYLRPTNVSFLLAEFVMKQTRREDRCIELGCGAGAVLFELARSGKFKVLYGVDKNHEALAFAKRLFQKANIEVDLFEMDVTKVKNILKAESFDIVVMNPPYHLKGQPNIDLKRKEVKTGTPETVKSFIEAATYLVRNKGKLFMAVKPFVFVDFLELMLERKLEPKAIQPVYGKKDREAFLLLVKSIKNGGRELHMLPPIVLS